MQQNRHADNNLSEITADTLA